MAESSSSLIDMRELSKPVSKLIDALSKAIGAVYEPTHIKRLARANAEASLIHETSVIDKEQLRKRAADRIVLQETRRQQNIEKISERAFDELPQEASNIPPDDSWMQEFFSLSQDVSDVDLQVLWARILAGEVSNPGTYTLRAMQLLKTLDTREAKIFFDFCSTVCVFKGDEKEIYARLAGAETNQYLYRNMSNMDLIHLSELGLVSYKNLTSYVMNGLPQEFIEIQYFHHTLKIRENFFFYNPLTWLNFLRPRTLELEFLTELGAQLLPVVKGEFSPDYLKVLKKETSFLGIKAQLKYSG